MNIKDKKTTIKILITTLAFVTTGVFYFITKKKETK